MFGSGLFPLGFLLFSIGLVLFVITYIILRAVPKIRPKPQVEQNSPISSDIPPHSDAVLMVKSGGRVSYLNEEARSKFNLWDDEPNLERMARQTRPSDAFLGLCATQGHARFSISGQWVEGTSYYFPGHNGHHTMFVSLRSSQPTILAKDGKEPPHQAVDILADLSQSIATDLDLETTLQATLSSVEQLIPTDFAEVTIWEPANQWLVPYRFVGLQGLDLHLEKTKDRYPLGEGYSGYVAEKREPLLVADVDENQEFWPIIDRKKYPFRSYLGVPLVLGNKLVGTLDLTSEAPNAYSENDLELLRLLSGQAAIALNNAMLFQEEQHRSQELTNLANLTRATSSIRDTKALFSHLVNGIIPLLDIEIVGFLLYNENTQKLEAQQPFVGVPPQFVDMYSVEIPSGSPAERIWDKKETIVASSATEDHRLIELGLDHPARAAGIRNTVFVPLTSGGRSLGYLQAANKLDDLPFDQDDIRILSIVTGQAAPIIENVDLIQQSVSRALRAESLRRVASLSGSTASLDEILKYSILELARLFQADYAAIFLLDENLGELHIHDESVYGVNPEITTKMARINANDPDFRNAVTHTKQPFLTGNYDEDIDILSIYQPFIDALQIKSALNVPIIIRDRGLGEVIVASHQIDYFTRSDIQLATTVASQLSVAIERSSLASQTDVDLRKRVDQLTALTRISRELYSSTDLNHLLQGVYEEAIQTTNADCGAILLFSLAQDPAEIPQVMLHFGEEPGDTRHPLEIEVLKSGEPIIVADFNAPAPDHLKEAWILPHEYIESTLIVPIGYQERIAGLIHLHSRTAGIFDHAALEITQALSVQAAIAIGNAQRYQEQVQRTDELNRQVETLSSMFQASQNLHINQPIEKTLADIATAIQSSTPFDIVLISIFDPQDEFLHRITGTGIPKETIDELKAHPQSWEVISALLHEDFRYGRSYYIPHDQRPAMPESWHAVTVVNGEPEKENGNTPKWHPEDLLLVPLLKTSGKPMGLVSVDGPRDNLRPDHTTIETLEIFASQAALAIESYQELQKLETQVDALTNKLDRSQNAQKQLPPLLEEMQANNAALLRLDQFVQRVTAGLAIIDSVNKQSEHSEVFSTLGQELRTRLGLDTTLVAETSSGGPRLLYTFGEVPEGASPEALFGRRNPLTHSLQSGEIYLINDLDKDENWGESPLLNALDAKAFITLPIISQGGQATAVLGISQQPLPPFTDDDERFLELFSRQVSTAINNLELLTDTGQRLREVNLLLDFSHQLGSLEPIRIMETLIDSTLEVLRSANASIVLLMDPESETMKIWAAKGYVDDEKILEVIFNLEKTVVGQVFKEGNSIRIDEVEFAQHFNLVLDNLLNYRDATAGKFPLSSMVVPIQSGESTLGVVIVDNFDHIGAFNDDDQALIESLARQTALTLENVRLYQAAEERATQLQALSDVATTITSRLEPELLIDSLLDSLVPVVPYTTGTLWLREEDSLTIQSARGFGDGESLIGISTSVEDSRIFDEMIRTRQPLSVDDVRTDDRFPSTEAERLSWLGVPLIAKEEVVGVIALEKTEAGFYTYENVHAATTFASQAAVALENATLFQESLQRSDELDKRTQRLALLNRFSIQISSTLDPDTLIDVMIEELQQAIPETTVSALMWEAESPVLRAEVPKISDEIPQELPSAPVFDHLRESLGIFNAQDIKSEEALTPLQDFLEKRSTRSLLVLPLAIGEDFHGFILIHSQQSRRFTPDEIELSRILINQAAVALQNASLFAQTRQLTEELEQRVAERTEQLGREHQRSQTLLRVMQELSASLDLDHVLNRTLALLNETTDAQQSTILLVRPNEKTFFYRASLGYTNPPPSGGRPSVIPLDEGLAGWVINRREGALIDNLLTDPRWIQLPDEITEHRSAIASPLMVGAEALGAMLLFHREPNRFFPEHLELVQAAANQIAISINNTELFNLIREQAESLGGMLRTQQVEASRSMAILEAVADGVLVTDSQNLITLFNESAQQILNLDRDAVVGKSLDEFTGIFGGAAGSWMETIRNWTLDPNTFESGDTYAERIVLDNKNVVSIHLAPVVMRNEFLGTVSIFRDITHQVEVDRLKSEFVATVSHELRTPMTSIKGYVEVLLMGAAGQLTEQQASFLGVVKTNTERLNILVNDLLDVSRIEAGKVTLSIQPLDLTEIAKEVVQEQERQSLDDEKPMEFNLKLDPDLPRVPGDLERVRQIMANLINNAYNYTHPDGQIDIWIHHVDDEVQTDIKDNGIGITPEEETRIFERFYRGEDPLVLATAGNGLGLSITKQLIEMHHGRIWMESKGIPGDGSTFYFTLPIHPHEEDTLY
jgi:GAF domain-containing protein